QEARLADPFEPGELSVPVQPVAPGKDRRLRRRDRRDARANVVSLDQRRDADPDAVDVGDRVPFAGYSPSDLDAELARAHEANLTDGPWTQGGTLAFRQPREEDELPPAAVGGGLAPDVLPDEAGAFGDALRRDVLDFC